MSTVRVDLVCEGGGVRGIGLVGAVDALAAAGYRFPRVAGTSAGAIVASLIAALQAAGARLARARCSVAPGQPRGTGGGDAVAHGIPLR